MHGVGIQTFWQKSSTQASSHLHLLSLSHHPGGLVVGFVAAVVVNFVVVVMDVVVGVVVVEVVVVMVVG